MAYEFATDDNIRNLLHHYQSSKRNEEWRENVSHDQNISLSEEQLATHYQNQLKQLKKELDYWEHLPPNEFVSGKSDDLF